MEENHQQVEELKQEADKAGTRIVEEIDMRNDGMERKDREEDNNTGSITLNTRR